MFTKSLFKRRIVYQAFLLAVILAIIITGVVYAVLINRKLSGGMILDGDVQYLEISPDGQYTVFKADAFVDEHHELFSVRTVGGNRVRLSKGLPNDCSVYSFSISPNSQHVIYSTTTETVPRQHCGLFSVPIGGGSPIELDPKTDNYRLYTFKISNNSSNVIFALKNMNDDRSILYRVPIRGGVRQAISEAAEGTITFLITSDSQNVVYRQEAGVDNRELIRSNMAGDRVTLCSGPILNFSISQNDEHVIFRSGPSSGTGQALYTVPTSGVDPALKVSGTGTVKQFQITPDSKYVVYLADEITPNMYLLYRVPVNGDTVTDPRISLTPWGMVPLGDVDSYQIAPDSQHIVYCADQHLNDKFDLYSIPVSGGLWSKLSKDMQDDGDVYKYVITPNSQGVVVIADVYIDNVYELFAVNMAGTWGVKLNQTLPTDSDVFDFQIAHNSLGVVYWADQEVYDVFNLYAVPIVGGESVRINPELENNRDVIVPFMITPDNKGVVYRADQERDEVIELFITFDYSGVIYIPLMMR